MNKWQNGLIALLTVFLIGIQGCSAQNTKIYRVGVLCGNTLVCSTFDGFKAKMVELGYQEGQNILYDYQKTNVDPAGDEHIIKRFIDEKVDLIFAFPHDSALTAKTLTEGTNLPVVFAYANIDDINLVNSLREPGANITGIQHPLDQLTVKRFEFLLEFDPSIQTIWAAYTKASIFPTALNKLREAAAAKQITLAEVVITNLDEMKADLELREKMPEIGVDAIFMMPDQLIQTKDSWTMIRDFAQRHNLPISANVYGQMKEGALFHLGNDYFEVGKDAATLTDKILQGTPPSELPVLSPEEYLRINLIAAQAIGLTVPEGLLKQAVEIIH